MYHKWIGQTTCQTYSSQNWTMEYIWNYFWKPSAINIFFLPDAVQFILTVLMQSVLDFTLSVFSRSYMYWFLLLIPVLDSLFPLVRPKGTELWVWTQPSDSWCMIRSQYLLKSNSGSWNKRNSTARKWTGSCSSNNCSNGTSKDSVINDFMFVRV